jgi:hypothetical protein
LENWRRGGGFPFALGPKTSLGGPGWDLINICVSGRFPTSYVVLVLIFNEVTYEAIVRYVDIVGNADHYCLNFLLIIIFMDILYDLFPHTINNHSKLPSVNP